MLLYLAFKAVGSQQSRTLLDDKKVRVTVTEVSHTEPFVLRSGKSSAIYVVLDPAVISQGGVGGTSRKVPAGYANVLGFGKKVQLQAESSSPARLIIIDPKTSHQDLTVSPFVLSHRIEDASDRNATLLIAISNCRFRDSWNLGNESEWIPSKPEIITMSAGDVKWLRPGIHHFKNLSRVPAKFVFIEW